VNHHQLQASNTHICFFSFN